MTLIQITFEVGQRTIVVVCHCLWWWCWVLVRGREGDIWSWSFHIVTCGGRWGVVILLKAGGGRGTYCHRLLWWCWMGLVMKKGGRGVDIPLSSSHVVTCGGGWGLVINKL